jgi:hypothetical protein
VVQHVGKRHLAVAVMVAVRLAVRGNVRELRRVRVLQQRQHALREVLAVAEQALERDGPRGGTVVEEQAISAPDGSRCRYAWRVSMREPLDVLPLRAPIGRTRCGLVGRQDGEAYAGGGEVLQRRMSTAVSGSHMPAGDRPKRASKSRIPQITCVRRSRAVDSGMMVWLYACASAEPWPNRAMLSRSASRTASYVSRACSRIHSSSVGPKLKLMRA